MNLAIPFIEKILEYIKTHPGVTMPQLAAEFPVENRLYGRQRAVSSAIAYLRAGGKIEDVERCSCCGCAKTRGKRNVPLFVKENQ